jgi:CubicO group peptidase (beta-lactamase class C family)
MTPTPDAQPHPSARPTPVGRADPFREPTVEPEPCTPLENAVHDQIRRSHIPGMSVAVVRHDRLLWASGHGQADLATGAPATPETNYLWFSMTKIATATAALALAASGRLDLDAPVREYVPAYPAADVTPQPTVRQLLNHTAGAANPPPIRWVHPADHPGPDPQTFLTRRLRRHRRPRYPIGGQAHYSNLGYLILAQAMAAASGQPITTLVTQTVLEPAGMQHTGYTWPSARATATGYLRSPRLATPVLHALLPGVVGPRHGAFQSFRPFLVDGAGYGGLIGDVLDAARLAALHLADGTLGGNTVISPTAARTMRTIATPGSRFDLGLGWFRPTTGRERQPAYVEHLGSGGGYYNALRIYPDLDLGIAIMANTTTSYDHDAICSAAATTFGDGGSAART